MRKIKLELDLPIDLLAGCVQIVRDFGAAEYMENEDLSHIVEGVLHSFIPQMRNEGFIPQLQSIEEAEEILAPFLASDEDKELAEQIRTGTVSQQTPQSPVVQPAADILSAELKALEIPDNDPLLTQCRGDSRLEEALLTVYRIINRESWGTEQARLLLENTISNMDKT